MRRQASEEVDNFIKGQNIYAEKHDAEKLGDAMELIEEIEQQQREVIQEQQEEQQEIVEEAQQQVLDQVEIAVAYDEPRYEEAAGAVEQPVEEGYYRAPAPDNQQQKYPEGY